MALYHMHVGIIGRSKGKSSVAAAAYRATEKIENRTTGIVHDFSRKEKALFKEIIAPDECPEWATNRAELWNRVEEKENRSNSQFARDFDIALQSELTLEQNIECVKKWVKINYVERSNLIADIAIHKPHIDAKGNDNKNIHAHVMISTRGVNKEGWTNKDREGNDRDFLKIVRENWAKIVNDKFKELKINERIDHRTLEQQGIDREPQQHQGVTATALERKGQTPNREKQKNTLIEDIKITTEELDEALENDREYVKLLEQYNDEKIKQMSVEEWQEFKKDKYLKMQKTAEQEALIMATKINIKELQKIYADDETQTNQKLKNHEEKKSEIADKKLLSIFYLYRDSKGVEHKKYEDYEMAEKKIIDTWQHEKTGIKQHFENMKMVKEQTKTANDKEGYFLVATNVKKTKPKIFEQLKNYADNLLKQAKEFAKYRRIKKAYERNREQKELELKQAKRQKSKDRGHRGHSY